MPPILFLLAGPHLNLNPVGRLGVAPLRGRTPLPAKQWTITGVTKDSSGTPLGGCVVQMFATRNDAILEEVVSDGSGNYTLTSPGAQDTYYLVAYKAGALDVAGTTVNTLIPT